MKRLSIFLFAGILFGQHLNAQNYAFPGALLNVNRIAKIYFNEGYHNINYFNGSTVIQLPDAISLIYDDGFLWCAHVEDGQMPRERVGGSNIYSRTGTVPGWIENGMAVDYRNNPLARVFRYRRNYQFLDRDIFIKEAAILFDVEIDSVSPEMVDKIYRQYALDIEEWPAEHGAPFTDLNENGIYEPENGEVPDLNGADKIIFYVRNDFDYGHTAIAFESLPIHLEHRVTAWAYDQRQGCDGVIIERHTLTSFADVAIDSMYIGYFSDPDVGAYSDDLVGCDTSKYMAYAYNVSPIDTVFSKYDLSPSAVGYQLLSGPNRYNGDGDLLSSAHKLSSFGWTAPGESSLTIPGYGPLTKKDNFHSFYNWLRGFQLSDPATPYLDPTNEQVTRFPLSGDPVSRDGDIDGLYERPGDRKMLLATGPVTLLPGESVETFWAVSTQSSTTNLSSLSKTKYYAALLSEYWKNPPVAEQEATNNSKNTATFFRLEPNFPNPFNGGTTIRFYVEKKGHALVDVFNVKGQRVATLFNSDALGLKTIHWQPKNLPSGTYIIRLQAQGSKRFIRAVYIK